MKCDDCLTENKLLAINADLRNKSAYYPVCHSSSLNIAAYRQPGLPARSQLLLAIIRDIILPVCELPTKGFVQPVEI